MPPNIYWIITTSLIPSNYEVRQQQYIHGISKTIELTAHIPNLKIIIVENNGLTSSFLDVFRGVCSVHYTSNNFIDCNFGTREILDVQDCIKTFNIQDEDYIVKQTGRYYLDNNSPFVQQVQNLETSRYECLITYGWYHKKSPVAVPDCISGLFCMKAKYAKQVENTNEHDFAEYRWARVTLPIPDEKKLNLSTLGIHICPGTLDTYFFV